MTMPVRWWSDLPDDLLDVVYSKVAGPLNRVRFAAVCRSWRATATTSLHAAPPVLPWLMFNDAREDGDKTMVYCPEDGQVFRMSLPSRAVGKRFVGAYDGGWVAALGHDMQLAVVNLFSGVEARLAAWNMHGLSLGGGRNDIQKIVFSESPASTGCILATITPRYGLALCRIGCRYNKWTDEGPVHELVDIVFCNGQLFGLTVFERLLRFQIVVDHDGKPMVTGQPHQIRTDNGPTMHPKNIVDLHGKPAMVVRTLSSSCEAFYGPSFKVFELVDDDESTAEHAHKWEEATSLGDYAVFLGKRWSKVAYVPAVGRGGLQRNCIYSTDDLLCSSTRLEDRGGRNLYPTSDRDAMSKIRSFVVARAPGGMWVLPPDF
ncbi:hypothetical protein D1007_46757 [Hordeum vulgare]|nr:hypothetical protein D1007_46757 [Hordeum vulgare]